VSLSSSALWLLGAPSSPREQTPRSHGCRRPRRPGQITSTGRTEGPGLCPRPVALGAEPPSRQLLWRLAGAVQGSDRQPDVAAVQCDGFIVSQRPDHRTGVRSHLPSHGRRVLVPGGPPGLRARMLPTALAAHQVFSYTCTWTGRVWTGTGAGEHDRPHRCAPCHPVGHTAGRPRRTGGGQRNEILERAGGPGGRVEPLSGRACRFWPRSTSILDKNLDQNTEVHRESRTAPRKRTCARKIAAPLTSPPEAPMLGPAKGAPDLPLRRPQCWALRRA
jgi:hypothetical protein